MARKGTQGARGRGTGAATGEALRRRPLWWLTLSVLLLVLFGLQVRLWFGEGSLRHVMELRERVETLEQENAALRERNRLMAADVEELKAGLDKVEEIARRDLGMIRDGESFFMVLEPAGEGDDDASR